MSNSSVGLCAFGDVSPVQVAALQALPPRQLAEALLELLTAGGLSREDWLAVGLELRRLRRVAARPGPRARRDAVARRILDTPADSRACGRTRSLSRRRAESAAP